MCIINVLVVNADATDSRNVKVGDTFTLYATSHSYTQSVGWKWDTSLFELQGQITGYSTSATFKAIKESPAVGSTIQATTYYYKNGTTASGINKEVDTWKIFVVGDGEDDTTVSMHMSSLSLGKGQTTNILAYASSNSYSGNYSWTTSNSSIIKILEQVGPKVSIKAVSSGSVSLKVILDNGNFDSLPIVVKDDGNDSGNNGENDNGNTQNSINYNETDYYYQISKKRMDALRDKAVQQHCKKYNHE